MQSMRAHSKARLRGNEVIRDDDLRILNFRGLPAGWRVAQLDSGHYIVLDPEGEQRSCITVNHLTALRWAKELAAGMWPES